MSFKPLSSMRLASCLAAFVMLALAVVPSVLAVDPPAISVNPIWRPTSQLDSINPDGDGITDAGDDLRYADAEIYVTTSVQFWAADVTCTVDKTVLETYTQFADTGTTPSPDDAPVVTEGLDWKKDGGGNFQKVVKDTVSTDGKLNFALTRIGFVSPMGNSGTKTTFVLATVRYRVKDQAPAAVFPKTSPFTCTGVFLDKNGKPVVAAPTVVPPAPLSVFGGYNIKGKVMYQAQTVHTGIVVNCKDSSNNDHFPVAPVTATGDFTVNTRVLGVYNCYFYGSKINADTTTPDLHLTSRVSFNMSTATYNLLPVTLRTGNVERTDSYIGFNDITAITANWNATAAAYTLGDANGDGKTNNADLALTSGNIYTYFTPEHIVNASHLIYSLPRDNDKFMNSHIWIGNYYGDASVSQFVPGVERNYWATMSPDGSKIAFVRNIGVGNADKFALFVAPVTGGVVGAAVNITPSALFDAFAPSWSPDGTTIAFACSYSRTDWTDGKGYGNLCLIGSSGANLRQKIALPASNNLINIHPVAWYNNTSMMYSSPDLTSTPLTYPPCHYQICTLDLTTMQNFVDPRTTFGSDMPVIRWGVMGPVLFYRYSAGATSKLRLVELTNNTYPLTVSSAHAANCTSTAIGSKHCDVTMTSPIPNFDKVGYFNVYTGNTSYSDAFSYADNNQYGIVLYTQNVTTGDTGGTNLALIVSDGDTAAPTWSTHDTYLYSVSNVVGNPVSSVTDFDPATEGYLALRNTIEWVP